MGKTIVAEGLHYNTVKAELFREPRGGKVPLITLGFGIVVMGYALTSPRHYLFILMGLYFGLQGISDTLPEDNRRIAGILRSGAIGILILFGSLFVLHAVEC